MLQNQNTQERIQEVLSTMEKRIEEKYIQDDSDDDDDYGRESPKLENKAFERVFESFKKSLGKDISSKDYMDLYTKTNIDSFIEAANNL